MAQDDVIDKKNPEALKKILEKEAEFDEEEAFYELCEIIEMARQTGNYSRFQNDLAQWKKHYPIELFSDKYKSKIKYMLSEEFLDSILKNYLAFERYSKLDPNKQLDKFRKIFSKAEQHKDPKKLDADLEAFYKDYPLEYLKEKFPHIVARLISKSNREKLLEKFDSREAYEEFIGLIYNTENFSSLSDLEETLKPLREKYPLEDFSDEYRSKLADLLKEDSLKKIFETSNEATSLEFSDLDNGTIITLEDEKALAQTSGTLNQKTAYFELLEIMKNPNDFNSVFNWTYKYMKYINKFDDYHKGLIISTLTPYYKIPKQHDYRIPIMDSQSNDYLSFSEYQSMDDIKKESILQYLAIISNGSLTNDDIERLETIHSNSIKAQAVDIVYSALDLFVDRTDNTMQLTLSDPEYFGEKPNNTGSSSSGVTIPQFEEPKKRNNNSGNTEGGGSAVSHAQIEEVTTPPTDFILSDDVKADATQQDDQNTLVKINFTNDLGNDKLDVKVEKTSSSNSQAVKEETPSSNSNFSSDETSFTSDESTAYKVIPFEGEENSNDNMERTITPNSNYIPVTNPEPSFDEGENNSNGTANMNKEPTPEQDTIRDFSKFAGRMADDDEREL